MPSSAWKERPDAGTQMTSRSSKDIHTEISDELRHTAGTVARIEVAVHSGVVTLSGEVSSVTERLAAKRAAIRVVGVTAVADNLQVRAPGAFGASDTAIAHAANRSLQSATDVPAGAVTVQVHDQVITLSGNLRSEYQRDAATRAVMYIKGVTGIANTITLGEEYTSTAGAVAG